MAATSIYGCAQNWGLITGSERFHYSINAGELIESTIFADSVSTMNGDTIYHINRIVNYCDTCANIETELTYNCVNCLYETQASQFIGKRITKYANNDWEIQDDNFNYLLKVDAQLGESWMVNEDESGVIVNTWEEIVFGQLDSLKTIDCANQFTIILSKNFGIKQFISGNDTYQLAGIGGREVGELIPDFYDVFNYEIGDVLQFETGITDSGTLHYEHDDIIDKITIIGVIANDEEVTIEFNWIRQKAHWEPPVDTTITSFETTASKVFSKQELMPEEHYNKQLLHQLDEYNEMYFREMALSDTFMDRAAIRKGFSSSSEPSGGIFMPYQLNFNGCYQSPDILPFNLSIGFSSSLDLDNYFSPCLAESFINFGNMQAQGLGIVHEWVDGSWASSGGGGLEVSGSYSRDSLLVGYVHNGVQIGDITPDEVLLALNENEETRKSAGKLYPNPTHDFLFVESALMRGNQEAFIYDAFGRQVHSESIEDVNFILSIDIRELYPGIYSLVCVNENGGYIIYQFVVTK